MNVKNFTRAALLLTLAGTLSADQIIKQRLQVVPAPQPGVLLPVSVQAPVDVPDVEPLRSTDPARTSKPPKKQKSMPKAKREEKLSLLNGNTISGKFMGMNGGDVLWKSESFDKVISVKGADIASLELSAPEDKGGAATSTIELVNGDNFQGNVVSLDAEGMTVETWFGGKLKIAREALGAIRPGREQSNVLYSGPDGGPDAWMTGNRNMGQPPRPFNAAVQPAAPQAGPNELARRILGRPAGGNVARNGINSRGWDYVGNGFVAGSSGPILGRKDIEMPDKCRIDFTLQWFNYFSLSVNFFSDKIQNEYTGSSYSIRMDQSNLYLYKYVNNNQSRVGQNVQSNLAQPRRKVDVTICVDKAANEISILLDGNLVKTWKDTSFAGKGNGLLFTSRSSYLMRLSNIRISEWIGALPEAGAEAEGNGKADFVRFKVGTTTLTGKAMTLQDGKLTFKSPIFGDRPLEMDKVALLKFANKAGNAKPGPGEMRAQLQGNGQLTVKILGWAEGKVRVSSPHLGEAQLDPAVFSKLEFNRHVPRKTGIGSFFAP